ncbi:hypothetical protein HYH03_016118 [Edaphochlamys debaryana]|uniref:Protein kinase domain-containing protein n=1 Tax=Edaphochlamys debaryana TaxID=47281 RepID=A0A835XJS7_9CHLO|nr:hypothetical protein HYH03_016118 [Edaphochlamys debaryana]|eukprot:KAG2485131.1 hypothetical protein HYH03_016118 [Edaphochlamys debaryana]
MGGRAAPVRRRQVALAVVVAICVQLWPEVAEGIRTEARTGRELALALANDDITAVRLAPSIVQTPQDWEGLATPIILRRNVTLESSGPGLAVLDFKEDGLVRAKMRPYNLTTGVVTCRNLVILHGRQGSTMQAPGLDVMASFQPPAGEAADGLVVLQDSYQVLPNCFPPDLIRVGLTTFKRPWQVPPGPGPDGANVYELWRGPQIFPGPPPCVNDTSAPPMQRCYPAAVHGPDFALYAMDAPGSSSTPGPAVRNGYVIWYRNSTFVCALEVPASCLAKFDPLLCGVLQRTAAPPPPAAAPQPPAAALGEPQAAAAAGGGGGGGGSDTHLAIALGVSLGGAAALAVAGVVAWDLVRRRRLRRGAGPSDERGSDASNDTPAAAGVASEAAAGKEVDGSASGPGFGLSSDDSGGPEGPPAGCSGAVRREPDCGPEPDGMLGCALAGRRVWELEAGDIREDAAGSGDDRPQRAAEQRQRGGSGAAVGAGGGAAEAMGGGGGGSNVLTLLPKLLGKGGFGRVVEGRYQSLPVAVKLLDWGGGLGPAPTSPTPSQQEPPHRLLQAFQAEVEVLARCRHPNVVSLLAVCVQPPRLCLVMERMDCSLHALVYGDRDARGPTGPSPRAPPIPLLKALHISHQVCSGLAYLHPHVVHRDLKPANVLLNHPASDRPCVKLVDFGLSRTQLTTKSTQNPEAGTLGYIAPEAYDTNNRVVRHYADMYSLGVLIWAMLTGRVPWEGHTEFEVAVFITIHRRKLRLDGLPPERCPPALRRLLEACWDLDPCRRPAAAELAKELLLLSERLQRGDAC